MTTVKQHARRAEQSDAASWGARAGFVSRGLLWATIGVLAMRVAGGSGEKADKQGALAALRDQPLGAVLLIALAAGFAAHALFRVLEGTVGRRDEDDGRKKALKRAWSWCRVVVYGFLAVSTVRFLMSGGSGGGDEADKPTAQVMELPAGPWLVGLVGGGIVLAGLVMTVRGFKQDFPDDLRPPSGRARTVVERIGTAGLVGRGLVYALVGSFLVRAAVTFDPEEAKGLDASLRTLADQPFGTGLLLFAAACLLSFALWSFVQARYRDL